MKKLILLLFAFLLLPIHLIRSQWYQQSIPVSKPITGIKFIDSLKGWACTQWGTAMDSSYILHTSNGGTNWVIQFRYPGAFFEAMAIVDANTGYVGGYAPLPGPGALIFKTTNGGLNWFNSGAPSGPTDMFFINRDTGWYCNNAFGGDIRRTTDGGSSWQLMNSGVTASVYRVFFLNYTTGWCGADRYLYKTMNAGQSWVLNMDFMTEGIRAVFFLNENTGWLGMTNRKIYYTSNSGNNWISQPNPNYLGTVNEIYFYNFSLGWAGSLSQYIYKTTDAGNNWGYQIDSSGAYRMSFVDSIRGWTGDTPGRNIVSHTINGGGPIFYTGLVSNGNAVPLSYKLYQNYPNPFNPYTTIKLDIYRAGPVSLYIYDILGREMCTIINQNLTTGTYEFNWDSRDYSSGVYVCRVTAEDFTASIKMILAK